MKKDERLRAEQYLLQCIFEEDPDFVDKTMAAFSVSRSTVYNYINHLQETGDLERVGGSMPYRLVYKTSRFVLDPAHERDEERFFSRDVAPLLAHLPENVRAIWRYAIMAMVNNALEHARASAVICVINRNRLCTLVGVLDNGVGIFRRICADRRERTGENITATEAAALLYPGGYTGDPEGHLGQGIFFTAHLMDRFAIRSDTQLFSAHAEDAGEAGERFRGTAVQMALANDSPRTLSEVLDRYIDPAKGFCRTDIPVARYFGNNFPAARGEARRLFSALEPFDAAELDLGGVVGVGQDFAHELFGVLSPRRPFLSLTVKNAAPAVAAVLRRAGYRGEL